MSDSNHLADKNLSNVVEDLARDPVNSHAAQQQQQKSNDRRHQDALNHENYPAYPTNSISLHQRTPPAQKLKVVFASGAIEQRLSFWECRRIMLGNRGLHGKFAECPITVPNNGLSVLYFCRKCKKTKLSS